MKRFIKLAWLCSVLENNLPNLAGSSLYALFIQVSSDLRLNLVKIVFNAIFLSILRFRRKEYKGSGKRRPLRLSIRSGVRRLRNRLQANSPGSRSFLARGSYTIYTEFARDRDPYEVIDTCRETPIHAGKVKDACRENTNARQEA
jgi:hypothetical protein